MAKKYYARTVRDFVREIRMGALVVAPISNGQEEREIAPPTVHLLPSKAGEVAVFGTKKARDAYVSAINADYPGAVVVVS